MPGGRVGSGRKLPFAAASTEVCYAEQSCHSIVLSQLPSSGVLINPAARSAGGELERCR